MKITLKCKGLNIEPNGDGNAISAELEIYSQDLIDECVSECDNDLILNEMDESDIIEFLEDNGYTVTGGN